MNKVSQTTQWVCFNAIVFLLLMSLLRVVFMLVFASPNAEHVADALLMGIRYDARVVAIPSLAIWLVSSIPYFNPFYKQPLALFFKIIYWLLAVAVLVFYTADFAHYAYLHQRLNATVLSYTKEASISTQMVWQSYPVIKWMLGTILFLWGMWWVIKKCFSHILLSKKTATNKWITRGGNLFFFITLCLCIFGRLGQYPLRWSDAQNLGSDYKASLAMNPFQSFASTMAFRDAQVDMKAVKLHHAAMAAYFGIGHPNLGADSPNITRHILPRATMAFTKPNVVLVICESFSMYKSSMSGSPLGTTPYFNSLCSQGIFFEKCFSPCYGTARGVWAVLTGTPDVSLGSTTNTRNPTLVSQHVIMNEFKGYEKFYFIGGSASWANLRGVLQHNIDSLQLYEQESYEAPKIDVWGISDKNVFLEANKVLAKQTKPFFSIIQTSDNHRPYTIPEEDKAAFKNLHLPLDSLKKYGFESEAEYNAFRYTDFCYQQFMQAAQKESYFANTIFVFVGDHGIRGNATNLYPNVWTEAGITCQHVPLLFYAPKMLAAKRYPFLCSQMDIMPTLAGLSGMAYTNNTMGTDILDPSFLAGDGASQKRIMVFDDGKQLAGTGYQNVLYQQPIFNKKGSLHNMMGNEALPKNDSLVQQLQSFTDGWFAWAKYLAYTNKK